MFLGILWSRDAWVDRVELGADDEELARYIRRSIFLLAYSQIENSDWNGDAAIEDVDEQGIHGSV